MSSRYLMINLSIRLLYESYKREEMNELIVSN